MLPAILRMRWLPTGELPQIWTWGALICALAAGAVWTVRRSRWRSPASEPACGQCGYFVTGLCGNVCPECGSDLRIVGVVAPGEARQAQARFTVAILALLLPLPMVIGWRVVHPLLPKRLTSHSQVILARPTSGVYHQIQIDAGGSRWVFFRSGPLLPTDLAIRVFRDPSRAALLFIDLGDPGPVTSHGHQYRILRRSNEFNRDMLLGWVADELGLDSGNAQVRMEMSELESLVQNGMRGGGFSPSAGSSWSSVSASSAGAVSAPLWMLFAWVALWTVAAVLVLRRMLRRPTELDVATAHRD